MDSAISPDKSTHEGSTQCTPLPVLTVKLEMRRAGLTGEAVARATGYTPSAVSLVVTGRRRNPIIETYIAARVGLPVRELFPPPLEERRARERRSRERRSA